MDPRLKAILKKSKEVDQAAKKYDTVDRTVLEQSVNSRVSNNSSGGGGLFDQMGVGSEPAASAPAQVNVYSEEYQKRVDNSKLPPEVQRAMRENPIPQPSMVNEFDMDDIKDINPGAYSEDDEYVDLPQERVPPRRQVMNENHGGVSGISEAEIRRMIAQEISKALPSVLENYFNNKIIKENTRLMKVLLKSTKGKTI